MIAKQLHPILDVFEAILARDIIDEDCSIGVSKVGWYKTLILLLSSSVPELQSIGLIGEGDIASEEVDANG